MRDNNKPQEYFNEILELTQKYTHDENWFDSYKKQNLNNSGEINFFPLLSAHSLAVAEDIPYMYCAGDSLLNIESRVNLALERCIETTEEINAQDYIGKTFFFINMVDPHNIHSAYCLLCWLICFNTPPEKIAALGPVLAPEGKDRLIDTILSQFQPDRVIASSSGNPATFQLLDDVIDASAEQRVELLQQYMKDWGKLLSNLKGLKSIGIFRKKKLTNKTLHKELEGKNVTYKGFWMWEVALLVKFFNIDDSSFRDNEFYPADMVHFK